MRKTVVTITGIRPDFIRMSEVFKKLDESPLIHHVLIHTGQHYDRLLSDVFFEELKIRKPDFNLGVGGAGKEHFHQTSEISVRVIELLRRERIQPDIILFLGDSNSVCCAVSLKKEGYKIGHIEAGMRSYDRRMLEETNRIVCDHCSDLLFVYHEDYAENLLKENIVDGIHVVGNTIVEVCKPFADELFKAKKAGDQIILDIHRPENFKYRGRLENILWFANECIKMFKMPVKMLNFRRTLRYVEEFGLDLRNIDLVELMSYKQFLYEQYHSLFLISDSGTAQEEPALLGTPVIVPRDYTERPQSVDHNCSYMIDVNTLSDSQRECFDWLDDIIHGIKVIDSHWLGDGKTSAQILVELEEVL